MKKILVLMLAAVMTTSIFLGGCTKKTTTEATKTGELPFVELNYYIVGSPQPDLAKVNEELNKLLLEKINAKVNINLLDWSAYDQKMSVMIASSEVFDACFTSSWMNNYRTNAVKGAFVPLDDMLDKYMPKTKASMSKEIWNAPRVNGKIYAVINQQIMVQQTGFSFKKAVADKYGFDPTKIMKPEDVTPYLKSVKENEADVSQILAGYGFGQFYPYYKISEINGNTPGAVRAGSTKVFNQYESEEFKAIVKLNNDWYTKGYIPEDVLTRTIDNTKLFMRIPGTYKPGMEADEKAYLGEEAYIVAIGEPQLNTTNVLGTMTAISATSKNPERTAMFLELMNTDKDVYNLMTFGVEGVHYKKTGDNKIQLIDNSGYYPNIAWELGNQFNAYLLPGQADDVWEKTKQMNDTTKPSLLMGFTFDIEPVKTEMANCSAVVGEYSPALNYGAVKDVDKYLAEFNAKLIQAGSEKILAEQQKQIDAFLASK